MQVEALPKLSILATLIYACLIGAHAAEQPLVVAPHLERSSGFIPLQFENGRWRVQGVETESSSALVLGYNPRAYATIEVYGEGLTAGASLEFLDGMSGQVLDNVDVSDGTSKVVLRTIPLISRRILVRVAGTRPAAGRIIVSRALVPKPSAGVPYGLMAGITPISSYRGTIEASRRALLDIARSIPLLQIAKPTETVACTGFLIAPDLLATAAHCVRIFIPNEQTSKWQTAPCVGIGILFDYLDASTPPSVPAAHCKAVKILPKEDVSLQLVQQTSLMLDTDDVAVLRIDQLAAKPTNGRFRQPLTSKDLRGPSLASVISYPQGDVEGVANDCEVYGNISDRFVLHRCSTAPGSSGAPVLELTKDGWRVVGLHICCDGGPIDGSTRPLFINAEKRVNVALRPSAAVTQLLR